MFVLLQKMATGWCLWWLGMKHIAVLISLGLREMRTRKKESFLSKSTNDIGIVVGCKTQVKATSFECIEKRALMPNRSSSYLCNELEINQVFLVEHWRMFHCASLSWGHSRQDNGMEPSFSPWAQLGVGPLNQRKSSPLSGFLRVCCEASCRDS